jgi:hypothetical protein
MGSPALDDDDLLTWARRTRHWYANERNDHARECAVEARFAEQRRIQLNREKSL